VLLRERTNESQFKYRERQNTGVIWSVNGIVGGNSTIGTVDSTGRYVAPVVVPPGGVVTVRRKRCRPSSFRNLLCCLSLNTHTGGRAERQFGSAGSSDPGPIGLTVTAASLYPAHKSCGMALL